MAFRFDRGGRVVRSPQSDKRNVATHYLGFAMVLRQCGFLVLLLLPVIYGSALVGENTTTLCPYEDNPFYLDSFQVPDEQDSSGERVYTKEVLVLEWVDRGFVGCPTNHNEEQKKKINLSCSTYRCSISDDCSFFLRGRINSIKATVQRNLIVLLKTKAIKLFNRIFFRKVVFKDQSITDLNDTGFWEILNTTRYRLYTGFTVPNKMEKVSLEDFDEIFGEGIKLYDEIQHADAVFSALPGSPKCTKEDKEKCNDINVERIYKVIVGDEDNVGPSGNINFGYARLRRLLEEGVRLVMKGFGKRDEEIKSLLLPLVPPCFRH